jgi:hypothetical protein
MFDEANAPDIHNRFMEKRIENDFDEAGFRKLCCE